MIDTSSARWNEAQWTPWAQPACPMLLCLTLEPSFEPLRALVGEPLFTSIILFREGMGTWVFRTSEADAVGTRMLDLLRVPGHRAAFDEGVERSIAELDKAVTNAGELKLRELSNEGLVAAFHRLQGFFSAFYRFGAFIEPIQVTAQRLLASTVQRLAGELEESESVVTEALYCLDTPTYVVDHLVELLEVFDNIKNGSQRSSVYSLPILPANEFLKALSSVDEDGAALLRTYVRKHDWIKNDYARCFSLSTVDFIEDDLAHYGRSLEEIHTNLRDQVESITKTRAELQAKKAVLLDRLTRAEAQIVSIHEAVGAWLLDVRKMMVKRANGQFVRMLTEMADRLHLPLDAMLFLLPEEIPAVFRNPPHYEERLRDRRQAMLVYQADFSVLDEDVYEWSAGYRAMDGPAVAEGEVAAGDLLETLGERLDCLEDSSLPPKDLHGVVVFSESESVTEGIVHIVRDPKGAKFPSGSILVTSSTTPEFLPLMRKASAIITDWGGQTSHAAIISRELRIPCVIGTNFGSYVLKTGEAIRIDWSTGRVTRKDAAK